MSANRQTTNGPIISRTKTITIKYAYDMVQKTTYVQGLSIIRDFQ